MVFSGSESLSLTGILIGPHKKVVITSLTATGAWLVTVTVTVAVPLSAVEQTFMELPDRVY